MYLNGGKGQAITVKQVKRYAVIKIISNQQILIVNILNCTLKENTQILTLIEIKNGLSFCFLNRLN